MTRVPQFSSIILVIPIRPNPWSRFHITMTRIWCSKVWLIRGSPRYNCFPPGQKTCRQWVFGKGPRHPWKAEISSVSRKETVPLFPLREKDDHVNYEYQSGRIETEGNFDLRVGESMVLSILTNGTRIPCRGRILAIKDFKNKSHARLYFARTSDMDFRKFSGYLGTYSRVKGMLFKKGGIGGLSILLAYIAYLLIHTYFFQWSLCMRSPLAPPFHIPSDTIKPKPSLLDFCRTRVHWSPYWPPVDALMQRYRARRDAREWR